VKRVPPARFAPDVDDAALAFDQIAPYGPGPSSHAFGGGTLSASFVSMVNVPPRGIA
jgi:hypothetical protein